MYEKPQARPGGSSAPTNRQPEVAGHPVQSPEDAAACLTDTLALRVLLKRNIRAQAPPPALLDDIRARIAKIRDAQ